MTLVKLGLLLIALIPLFLSKPTWQSLETTPYSFEQFTQEYIKTYDSHEDRESRRALFESRMAMIKAHNRKNLSWKLGVNHMLDYTEAELKSMLGVNKQLMYKMKQDRSHEFVSTNLDLSVLPDSVDWRDKGVVTPVKDQGRCGSCWSFASAETIESMWALSTGKLVELSEQNILDCTPNPHHCGGTGGCGGGTAELAFSRMMDTGIASEWTYPYMSYGGKNFDCNKNAVAFAKVNGYVTLPANQYAPLIAAVATLGPIAISVDASSWHFYDSGVFDGCNQTYPDIDHAVQLVGYGTDPKLGDYWLVRNSWSPNYGENGYIRIKREAVPRCAVDITPSDGTGCDGGPSQVTVCGTCGILYDSAYPIYP